MFGVSHVKTMKWGTSGHKALRPFSTYICKKRLILKHLLARKGSFYPTFQWHLTFPVCNTLLMILCLCILQKYYFSFNDVTVTFYLERISKYDRSILWNAEKMARSIHESTDCMCFVMAIFTYCTFLCTYAKNQLFHYYWCFCNKGLSYSLPWFNRCVLSPAVHLGGSPVHEPVHYGFPGHFYFKVLFQ